MATDTLPLPGELVDEHEAAAILSRHRGRLVVLTAKGKAVLAVAMQRQGPWVDALAQDLAARDIQTALRVLRTLHDRLRLQNDLQAKETGHVEELI